MGKVDIDYQHSNNKLDKFLSAAGAVSGLGFTLGIVVLFFLFAKNILSPTPTHFEPLTQQEVEDRRKYDCLGKTVKQFKEGDIPTYCTKYKPKDIGDNKQGAVNE